ncbi:MAG: hypothetical protein ABWJ42_01735 [Sulfolobales archaeon]
MRRSYDLIFKLSPGDIEISENLIVKKLRKNLVEELYVYRDSIELSKIIKPLYSDTRRIHNICSSNECDKLRVSLAVPRESVKSVHDRGLIVVVDTDYHKIYVSKSKICYNENRIGPFKIVSREIDSIAVERGLISIDLVRDSRDICEHTILISREPLDLESDYLQRIYRGYYEDGLIWALIRSGAAKREVLPREIEDEQAYYWPRGDLLRKSLYQWYSYDDSASLHVYTEILQQIIDQMSRYGGLLIPYITAARKSNIYGAPQQIYVFESLYRGYQILGSEALREKALESLKCFITQPPECLGYYTFREGGLWFRWGSYHYLSRDPEGREDLYVLNTHLMGVVALLEARLLEACDWCEYYAREGVKAVVGLLREFQREDGYLYYSLYNKERFGEKEDLIMPHTIGYHTLSSRLMIRAGRIAGERVLVESGLRGCRHSIKRLYEGRYDLRDEILRCLVEFYRFSSDRSVIREIDEISRRIIYRKPVAQLGYSIDESSRAILPPAIRLPREIESIVILLLEDKEDHLKYYLYTPQRVVVEIIPRKLPSGRVVKYRQVDIESLGGESREKSPCEMMREESMTVIQCSEDFSGLIEISL